MSHFSIGRPHLTNKSIAIIKTIFINHIISSDGDGGSRTHVPTGVNRYRRSCLYTPESLTAPPRIIGYRYSEPLAFLLSALHGLTTCYRVTYFLPARARTYGPGITLFYHISVKSQHLTSFFTIYLTGPGIGNVPRMYLNTVVGFMPISRAKSV